MSSRVLTTAVEPLVHLYCGVCFRVLYIFTGALLVCVVVNAVCYL